eukprot:7390712-Prymnesium_polylepis.1
MTNDLDLMLGNKNLLAHWRVVRRSSRAWRQRDRAIVEAVDAEVKRRGTGLLDSNFDLDQNAVTYILVDNVHPKKGTIDTAPFGHFMNELVRFLANRLPSLAIRTGLSAKMHLGNKHAHSLEI